MSRDPAVAELVRALVGTWTGGGTGKYPTIEPFRYREVTRFEERSDHPSLLFEQRTWRTSGDGEAVSHWETGLLRLTSDGSARLHDAQPGRVEVLTGSWREEGEGRWVISLAAAGFAGDDRVIDARRRIEVEVGRLRYVMEMETTSTHALSLHLEADLFRS